VGETREALGCLAALRMALTQLPDLSLMVSRGFMGNS